MVELSGGLAPPLTLLIRSIARGNLVEFVKSSNQNIVDKSTLCQ